ncbi:hypothetical protein WT60_25980 [Burkholderia sp. MSMB617WGS]|nr:hypothetical protein WT60_25980 [Burkholderia sp. MSMB617WGS]KWZ47433.1 hypothetical protein WS73_02270 [Burkholderia savannae]
MLRRSSSIFVAVRRPSSPFVAPGGASMRSIAGRRAEPTASSRTPLPRPPGRIDRIDQIDRVGRAGRVDSNDTAMPAQPARDWRGRTRRKPPGERPNRMPDGHRAHRGPQGAGHRS